MAGVSIETTLELWASSLREMKARMRPLFTQERLATSAGLFLDGWLGEERRKTGRMRAEAASEPGPWWQQAILGRGRWDVLIFVILVAGSAASSLSRIYANSPSGCARAKALAFETSPAAMATCSVIGVSGRCGGWAIAAW